MNTANLQLQGFFIVIASVNEALIEGGVISREERALAPKRTEQTALGDHSTEEGSTSYRDAIAFPARLLALANNSAASGFTPPFSELAKMVGELKEPHNDQM